MDPVGLWIAHLRGLELPSAWGFLVWGYLPNYVCAVIAVLPASVIMHLGKQVSRAREMGSYRLADRIGSGGMGEVWRAHHRLLARPSAIKLIPPGHARMATTASRREPQWLPASGVRRRLLPSLRSPHSIQLYDFGVTRDGRFYLVMELLDGVDLETLVRRFGPQPPARVVRLLRQACHSLAEAHASGLVHRDIKPANLHLCRLGTRVRSLKVLDFGLAKPRDQHGATAYRPLLTAPQATTGTPAYMPPEMASGDPVDGRVDLYSLGCVGYFLLTGKLVFEGENALRMIIQHLQSEPVPPSTRLGRPLPDELERLVLDCLAKNPDDRPPDAAALGRGLSAAGADQWTQDDARHWWETTFTPSGGGPVMAPPTEFLEIAEPHGVSPADAR